MAQAAMAAGLQAEAEPQAERYPGCRAARHCQRCQRCQPWMARRMVRWIPRGVTWLPYLQEHPSRIQTPQH